MKTILLSLFIFLIGQTLFGQSRNVIISGTVSDFSKNRQTDIPIILLENTDTLLVVKTNDNGEFEISTIFSVGNDYYILLDLRYNRNKTTLHLKGDTLNIDEYQLDLLLPRLLVDRFDNGAKYDFNEIKNYQNFEIDNFKQIVIQYPQLCVEFQQYANPKEKMKVLKQRIKNFKKELYSCGINMKQISFSKIIFKLNSTDQKSIIQVIVLSMDGNCKK